MSLSVKSLTVEFTSGGYKIRPLNGFSFDSDDGQLVVLLGPSGCGKTTLLSCLAGLLKPTSGSIRFRNVEITGLRGRALAAYRRQTVGVVFQAFNLIPSLNARANVMVPLRLSGVSHKDARERAATLLALVGLSERAGHRPGQMSGGQQQRAAIARALVQDPPLVLADEPTAHLDYIQVEGILQLLRDLASPGRMVVVATHDQRITQLADKVVEMTPHLPEAQREPREVTVGEGQYLFRQGDPSDLVYVVRTGEIEILREKGDGTQEHVTVIGADGYFGELGPMLNLPRSASARAVRPTVLTGCSVQQFRALHRKGREPTAGPRPLLLLRLLGQARVLLGQAQMPDPAQVSEPGSASGTSSSGSTPPSRCLSCARITARILANSSLSATSGSLSPWSSASPGDGMRSLTARSSS